MFNPTAKFNYVLGNWKNDHWMGLQTQWTHCEPDLHLLSSTCMPMIVEFVGINANSEPVSSSPRNVWI